MNSLELSASNTRSFQGKKLASKALVAFSEEGQSISSNSQRRIDHKKQKFGPY